MSAFGVYWPANSLLMPDQPTDTLAVRLARRILERDNPPPPPPLSQEPLAVLARLEAWLLADYEQRDSRSRPRQARMLLALLEAPECSTAELAAAAGQPQRAAARTLERLADLGLLDSAYRGVVRYHRLSRAAEDALLLVVAGPPAPAAAPGV